MCMECARCKFFTQHAFFSRPHGTPLRLDLDSFAGSANKAQFGPLDDSGSYILPRLVRQIDHPMSQDMVMMMIMILTMIMMMTLVIVMIIITMVIIVMVVASTRCSALRHQRLCDVTH